MRKLNFIFALFVALLISACGGGGGSGGANPNQPTLTSTAGDILTIPAGAFRQYALSGGVPPYQATSSEPAIAVGNVIGNSLSIGAIAGGKAIVRVFDYRGTIVATEVTVGSSIPLHTTAPSPFKLRPSGSTVTCTGSLSTAAERAVYAISGGSPPYRVVSSNTEVLAVALTDASHWEAVATSTRGEATVRIADAAGASLSIDFSNISTAVPAPLRLASEALTLPVGYEAEVTVAGGVPPYRPATGIPAAIQVTPSCSEDGKFKIMGILASELDIGFVDYVGQTAKVKVTVNTATVSFRMSPSPMRISEIGSESITLSLFGFYGDTGTDVASGDVCIYVSDPSYFALDPVRTQCSKFSPATRTFTLNTGSRGNRCVSANKDIQIRAVDSKQQIADGVITILDNGTGCNTSGQLTLSPSAVVLDVGSTVDVLIRGGTGSYVATPANGSVVSATVAGDVLSVVGGTSGRQTTVLVTDSGSGQSVTLAVTVGAPIGGISVTPPAVTVSRNTSTAVQVLGGSGTFTASSLNSAVVTAFVSGSRVDVTGGSTNGVTSVVVVDSITGSTANISVTNGNAAGALTFSPSAVTVAPGESNTVVISGGSGNYQATSNSPSVAVPSVSGSNLRITGGTTRGATTITVVDTATGNTGSVSVTNGNAAGPLTFSPSAVTVDASTTFGVTVAIRGGSGQYTVVSANQSIAKVTGIVQADGTFLIYGGENRGITTITVTDLVTGFTGTVSVTNGNAAGALTFSPSAVTVAPGESNTVVISGGSGNYQATSNSPSVAVPSVSGSNLRITGGATRGAATITVVDTATGNTGSVSVTNGNAAGALTFSPSAVTVAPGESNTVVISGGSGNYQATSNSPSVAVPSVTGSNLRITGGSTRGAATITVVDTSTGNTGTVNVTNGNAAGPLTFSPSAVAASPLLTSEVAISGGSGQYTVVSNNPVVATATVANSVLRVTGGSTRGTATVTVTDIVTGITGAVSVTNGNAAGALTFSPSSITVSPLLSSEVVISGGSGVYAVVSSSPNVANGSVSGSRLTVSGGSVRGTATLTVTDTATGTIGAVSVVNGNATGALTLSPVAVTVTPGTSNSIGVAGGSGSYIVASSNPFVATASVPLLFNNTVITVTGESARGTAIITVTDSVTGSSATVTVTNGNLLGTLRVSPSIVYTTLGNPGTSVTTVISGGSGDGNYRVSNVNSAIVENATIAGVVATFQGGNSAGAVTAVVYDVVTGDTATILVINNAANALVANPANIAALTVGASLPVAISNGTGSYRVSSADPNIASITIVGQTATVFGVARGATNVTATDTTTGRSVIIGVSVQ